MTYQKILVITTLFVTFAVLPAESQDHQSIQNGIYSAAQANQGSKLFASVCSECHQEDEFSSAGYLDSWTGAPVAEFMDLIQMTMPEDNPGSLRNAEYAAIIAYFFELNGIPMGDAEMDSDIAALEDVVIEGPYVEGGR